MREPNTAFPISVVRWVPPPHQPRAPAMHTHATLVFYTGGSARVALHQEYELRAGEVMIIPAGAPHRMIATRAPELWGLGFCVPCFAGSGDTLLLEPFERVRDGASPVVKIPAARHAFLSSLFEELSHRRGQRLDSAQHSLLTLILSEVATHARAINDSGTSGVVASALRFIERNALRPLTLKEVAKAVHKSPAYVTTALRRATGKSAVQWIIAGRMAEARRLLLHSDELVEIVAERVGYADPTHFIRTFRREHGVTPAAWRRTNAQRFMASDAVSS